MNTVNISVIVPTYNRENTIQKCLESIINQTSKVYEILVIDDGSEDNTLEVVSQLETNVLIRVFQQKHRGAQAARNKGIREAKGNYVAFLDSDDEWVIDIVETYKKIFQEKPDVVIYSDCYVYDEKDNTKKIRCVNGKTGYIYQDILLNGGPMFQGMMCKKSHFETIGYLDEKVPAYQEWDTSCMLSKNYEFIHVHKPMFVYNLHLGDTISKDKMRAIDGYMYITEKYQDQIIKEHGLRALSERYKYLIEKSILSQKYRFEQLIAIYVELIKEIDKDCCREDVIINWGIELSKELNKRKRVEKLLIEWIQMMKKNISLADRIRTRGYERIAVYGMNCLGKMVCEELRNTEISVVYAIDRNANDIESDIRIIKPCDTWEKVDAVIVTALTYYEEIYNCYHKKCNIPIISITSVINNSY